jgi:hypothetical protein
VFCSVTTDLTQSNILVYLRRFGQHMQNEFGLDVENGKGRRGESRIIVKVSGILHSFGKTEVKSTTIDPENSTLLPSMSLTLLLKHSFYINSVNFRHMIFLGRFPEIC